MARDRQSILITHWPYNPLDSSLGPQDMINPGMESRDSQKACTRDQVLTLRSTSSLPFANDADFMSSLLDGHQGLTQRRKTVPRLFIFSPL